MARHNSVVRAKLRDLTLTELDVKLLAKSFSEEYPQYVLNCDEPGRGDVELSFWGDDELSITMFLSLFQDKPYLEIELSDTLDGYEGYFHLRVLVDALSKQIERNLKSYDIISINDEIKLGRAGLHIRHHFESDVELSNQYLLNVFQELWNLVKFAESSLGGLPWDVEYEVNEAEFCKKFLHPLLMMIGFHSIKYTHGKKEYGKDFIFSENTAFGNLRHYGLQAKAGNISGAVNSDIDFIVGQLNDAFSMPFQEIDSNNNLYISTFILAISGNFTENAKEKIRNKIPKGLFGSVYFFEKDDLKNLSQNVWRSRKCALRKCALTSPLHSERATAPRF